MRKLFYFAVIISAAIFAAISCTKEGFQIDDPDINESGGINMYVGDFYIVNCTPAPQTAKWSSSNTDVATVEDGVIFAHNPGNAKISANPKVGKKISFNVFVAAVPITDFTIAESISLYAGNSTYLEISELSPENASISSIAWESSDNSVFTVTLAEGGVKINGIAEGTAKLTGRADGVTRVSTVTVKGPEKLSLPSHVDAYINHEVEVSVVQEPEVYKDYNWSIRQDGNICSVRSEGAKAVLTGVALGKCTLELSLAGGSIKKSCEVTVHNGSLVLDKSESTLLAGDELTLTATQYPVQYNDYEWASDDASVATVSGNGKTAVVKAGDKTGETVIRCYINGRDISASCRVSTFGPDYLDKMGIVLVEQYMTPKFLGENVYVSPKRSSDTELRVMTIYRTDLPECFKGRVKWSTGTPSADSYSTVIKNQSSYRNLPITCSTPVGDMKINYIQGFMELEVREFDYSDFRVGSSIHYNWYQQYGEWYFKPFYQQIPDKTAKLDPVGWSLWSISPDRAFFFTGVDDYGSRVNCATEKYGIATSAEGLTVVTDKIKLTYDASHILITSYERGYWLKTDDVTSSKTVDGTVTVHGQSFKIHCIIKP